MERALSIFTSYARILKLIIALSTKLHTPIFDPCKIYSCTCVMTTVLFLFLCLYECPVSPWLHTHNLVLFQRFLSLKGGTTHKANRNARGFVSDSLPNHYTASQKTLAVLFWANLFSKNSDSAARTSKFNICVVLMEIVMGSVPPSRTLWELIGPQEPSTDTAMELLTAFAQLRPCIFNLPYYFETRNIPGSKQLRPQPVRKCTYVDVLPLSSILF